MKILAAIVSYYPDKDLLIRNVRSFIDYVDKVLIWENTPARDVDEHQFLSEDKIEYCGIGENIGISKALNHAVEYAEANGFDYLLTMDQDSVWEGFDAFLQAVQSEGAPFGLYGPAVFSEPTGGSFSRADDLITSGMLVPIEVYDRIGNYDESFFVDGIDLDFCYRAADAGIPSWTVECCRLRQRFGEKSVHSFFGHHPIVYNYSPGRLYEMFRSQIIVMRRYESSAPLKRRFFFHTMLERVPRILILEKNRLAKFKAIVKGILDGLWAKV